ncbi:uncharacterized protein LOC128882838, partial [Hylaeus volcanicus]|uniref:uncharacterized protein LOC128882838 n=1 Tax=Hylaeus volcanicus TaxID=313075 RepID=UPI0023B7F4D1
MAEAIVSANLAIETFDPAITHWKRWLKRFEGAVTVFGVPETKKSFDIICDKLVPDDPYKKTYKELTDQLEEFYATPPLKVAENFRFHQRKQQDGETIQQFVASLHKLSINCNFGQYLQTALRNQFIFGVNNRRIQSRLLETKNVTFKKAVEVAVAIELSEKGVNQIQSVPQGVDRISHKETYMPKKNKQTQSRNHPEGRSNNFTKSNKRNYKPISNSSSPNISCFRCGEKHLATKCTLDKNIVCNNCGVKGHLQKVCMRRNRVAANQLSEILWMHTDHQSYTEKFYVTVDVEKKQ